MKNIVGNRTVLIFLVLISSFVLLFGLFYWFNFSTKTKTPKAINEPYSKNAENVYVEPQKQTLAVKLSPSGNFLAYVSFRDTDDKRDVSLSITGQNNEYEIENNHTMQVWHAIQEQKNYPITYLSWSSDENQIGMVVDTTFVVIRLEDGKQAPVKKEVIKPKIEFEGQLTGQITGELGIWFEEDNLVASMQDGVYSLWPERIKLTDIKNSKSIYPTVNGYLFWRSDSECCGSSLFYTSKSGNNVTDTGISVEDYYGAVLTNSTGRWLCTESGSSGYYGYLIYDLLKKEVLSVGQQYSYCGQWLNEHQVSLIEIPYYHQWSKQIYTYDVIKRTREPMTNISNSNVDSIDPFDF